MVSDPDERHLFCGSVGFILFLQKRLQRAVLVSCLFPLVFAFCFSLTPDITVNHKYIMISYAFLAMFWAGAVCLLFRRKWQSCVVAVVLSVCLTITGIYDFVIIVRDNGPGHIVTVNTNSSLTDWLAENLDSRDLILTRSDNGRSNDVSGLALLRMVGRI